MNKLKVITIANTKGMELKVTNYGATIIGLKVFDKHNKPVDVVVGLSDVTNYVEQSYHNMSLFLGSTIGRYAGRISKGKFEVDGEVFQIKHKNGVHLHSDVGFDKQYWTIKESSMNKVTFTYVSKHLENGYPGNLSVQATFQLFETNTLQITYEAKTDKATPINLTTHPYFNLNGGNSILNHDLIINSDQHLEVDSQLIPTGRILNSKNTVFDYTQKTELNKKEFTGFDDTFVLNKENLKASLISEKSGIQLNVYTNQPALVIYTPKKFPNLPFIEDQKYAVFPAICFEPQNYPDAPNNPNFPNSILKPGEEYSNNILFEFAIV